MKSADQDLRFDDPLYSLADAARFLDVPYSTFASWRKGYVGRGRSKRRATYAPVLTPSTRG